MSKAIEKAIKSIKAAGFTHIKLELEAELARNDTDNDRTAECENCEGSGVVELQDAMGNYYSDIECAVCYGEGEIESEEGYNWRSEEDCEQFIRDNITVDTSNVINYMNFYNDGSVDSELTFTLPVDKPEAAMDVIRVFKLLADEIGNGMDVDGAGMHISVLTSGQYPSREELPQANIRNFKNEVSKLLPALFIAATSGGFTRELGYRYPRIDSYEKYSAIYTHNDTCLEYRLFETCYQRPEALLEYLGTIAKTLEYYTDTDKKVASMGSEYHIYDDEGLSGFTKTPEQVRILKKQFTLVKPEGYTIKQLMNARGVDLRVEKATERYKERIDMLRKAYKEHKRAVEERKAAFVVDEYAQDNIKYWQGRNPEWSYDTIMERVAGFSFHLDDEKTYINKNLHEYASATVSV